MKKLLLVLPALALIAAGCNSTTEPNNQQTPTEQSQNQNPSENPAGGTEITSDEVRSFTVEGKNFSFTPNEIRVKKGETVKINFKNSGGNHDLVIDEFDAKTKILSNGQSEEIQFYADKSGTFEFYCSVGNHREMGMKGKLIVE